MTTAGRAAEKHSALQRFNIFSLIILAMLTHTASSMPSFPVSSPLETKSSRNLTTRNIIINDLTCCFWFEVCLDFESIQWVKSFRHIPQINPGGSEDELQKRLFTAADIKSNHYNPT